MRWRYGRRDALVPLAIVAVVLIESALKILLPHAPPPADRTRTVELLPFLHVSFVNSFPSGHVARTAFLLRIANGVPWWLVATGIALMVLSRVYLAEHWLSDTIGGLVLGLAVAEIARRIR